MAGSPACSVAVAAGGSAPSARTIGLAGVIETPPTRTVTLTDELYDQASREAAAEGKTTDEIAREALTAYLALRQLDRLQEYGQRRADELGLAEADLPRLIAETRRQSHQ